MPSISERDLAWAWWTCIQEPEDAHAHALRLHLGLIESVEWVRADSPGPLPPPLSQHRKTLEDAWKRFKPRALRNNVNQELAAIHALGGRFISQEDPSFPKELNILQESTPLGLWVRGTLPHTLSHHRRSESNNKPRNKERFRHRIRPCRQRRYYPLRRSIRHRHRRPQGNTRSKRADNCHPRRGSSKPLSRLSYPRLRNNPRIVRSHRLRSTTKLQTRKMALP